MWALQDLFRFPAVTGPPPPGQQDPALLQSIRRPRSSRKGRVRGLINRGGGVESSGPERGLDSGDSWLAMWPIRKGRGFGLVARDRPGARGGTPISRQKPKMLLGRKSPVPPPPVSRDEIGGLLRSMHPDFTYGSAELSEKAAAHSAILATPPTWYNLYRANTSAYY